jgi:hypothetical protein
MSSTAAETSGAKFVPCITQFLVAIGTLWRGRMVRISSPRVVDSVDAEANLNRPRISSPRADNGDAEAKVSRPGRRATVHMLNPLILETSKRLKMYVPY